MYAYISLRGDEGVKPCTCAFRARSFTAWFSLLKCIKNDRKIQGMGQKMYIFTRDAPIDRPKIGIGR